MENILQSLIVDLEGESYGNHGVCYTVLQQYRPGSALIEMKKKKKKKKKICLCNFWIALSPSGDIAVHWQYTQVVLNLETRSCNFKVSRHRTFIYYAFQCLLSLVSAFSEKSLVYSDTINNLLQECDCTGAKLGTALTALKLMEIEIDRSV